MGGGPSWLPKALAHCGKTRFRLARTQNRRIRGRLFLAWVREMQVPAHVERRILEKQDREESKARPAHNAVAAPSRLEGRPDLGMSREKPFVGSPSRKTN